MFYHDGLARVLQMTSSLRRDETFCIINKQIILSRYIDYAGVCVYVCVSPWLDESRDQKSLSIQMAQVLII